MTTKQIEPDLDSWRDQERRQHRSRQRRRFGAIAVAAAIGLGALLLVLVTRPGETAAPPATEGQGVYPAEPGAVTIATDFIKAYDSFDAEAAIGYLADGADVSVVGGAGGVGGALDEWPLNLSWWKATGYETTLDPCEVTRTSAAGTSVRCTLEYQNFGSEKIGRGPFTGSYWDLTVRDGQIVSGSQYCEIAEFSPQMWEPFSRWVAKTYPDDAKVMFANGFSDYRLTQRSIALWEQHTKDYVEAVKQGTAK